MANYVLLQKTTLNGSVSSITFNNLPQTGYTDLKIVASTRYTGAGYGTDMGIAFNGSTSNFSSRRIYGYGGSATSDTQTNVSGLVSGSSADGETFAINVLEIPNYTSANNKSYSITASSENNNATSYILEASNNLWSNTASITSITFSVGSSALQQFSTFSIYGVAAIDITATNAPKATGGTSITTDGTYWYHTFISSGYFTPLASLTCDYIVVGGGGSGGGASSQGAVGSASGGGGGGGFLSATSASVSATGNLVLVGAGGNQYTSGNPSQFLSSTAYGGGAGGTAKTSGGLTRPSAGGSGGGGATGQSGAAGTSGQGNNGGTPTYAGDYRAGGGGGGAGANGANGADMSRGDGGVGISSSISGTATYYAGGGGGGGYNANQTGLGGNGGGGRGGNYSDGINAVAGTAGTGGGGGGGSAGRTGGSGIVVIRYAV